MSESPDLNRIKFADILPFIMALVVSLLFLGSEVVVFKITKQELPFMALGIAIVASTYGLGPALLVSGASMLCEAFFFIEPYNSIGIGSTFGIVKFLLYSAIAVLMSVYLGRQKRLSRKLENIVESQKLWVANVSHEIRTPLNGILGFTRLMLDSKIDDEQGRHLRLIDLSAKRLLGLVSDLLNFSQIQSKKVKLENHAFDPEQELRTVLEILRPKAIERGVFIAFKIDGVVNYVRGDSGKFDQILINLIDNAIKFSGQGGRGRVEVSLNLATIGNQFKKIDIVVRDFGMGISEIDQQSLFTPFFRSRSLTSELVEGTGLGLSIVKGLVDMMKGKISVESVPDQGTIFKVTLSFPIVRDLNELTQRPNELTPMILNFNQEHPLALVAEDNRINQIIIQTYLEKMGFRVDLAGNGLEAVQMAQEHKYHLIIVDRLMPLMNGFKAARLIRAHYGKVNFSGFEIWAMTADSSIESLQEAKESGLRNVLMKPIDFDQLKALIGSGVEVNYNSIGLRHQELSRLSRSIGAGTLEEILKLFVNQAPERISRVKQLLAERDFKQLESMAHNLKSSCLAIGAETAAKFCMNIESASENEEVTKLTTLVGKLDLEFSLCVSQMREFLKINYAKNLFKDHQIERIGRDL